MVLESPELSKTTVHRLKLPLIPDPSPPPCKDKAGETDERRYQCRRITFRETFLIRGWDAASCKLPAVKRTSPV